METNPPQERMNTVAPMHVALGGMLLVVVVVALGWFVFERAPRSGWKTREPSPPGIAWLMGLAVFVPGWTLVTWSMSVNPFFEKQVRIQTNHGHHVIDSGPTPNSTPILKESSAASMRHCPPTFLEKIQL